MERRDTLPLLSPTARPRANDVPYLARTMTDNLQESVVRAGCLVRPHLSILSAEECVNRLLHRFNVVTANIFRSNTDVTV
jgi:hypothetical protein